MGLDVGQRSQDARDREFFERFENVYERWSSLYLFFRSSVERGNSCGFASELDEELSYVNALAVRVSDRSTQTDFRAMADAELVDLRGLTRKLHQAAVADSQKSLYLGLLTTTRDLVECIGAIPVPEEGHLGFPEIAQRDFRFLVQEYGFHVSAVNPLYVRYESAAAKIELRYSRRHPEMTFSVSEAANEDPSRWFYLDDLLYAVGQNLSLDYSRFDLDSKEGVQSFVWEVSAIVQKYGTAFLRGESGAFELLVEKAAERDRRRSEQLDGAGGPG